MLVAAAAAFLGVFLFFRNITRSLERMTEASRSALAGAETGAEAGAGPLQAHREPTSELEREFLRFQEQAKAVAGDGQKGSDR